MKETVQNLIEQTSGLDVQGFVNHIVKTFGNKVALASSFGAEDQVLTDMLAKATEKPNIFTLDTGRLPQETYDVLDETRKKYGFEINIYFPDAKRVEEMVNQHGANLFYESVENRKMCCGIRKIEPLKRALSSLDAWIVGLRKGQSVTRFNTKPIELDEANGLIKIAPLAEWSDDDVWDYIKKNHIPYNKLHDKGYPTIGCAPCTRAVKKGEDIRAGRWWWEEPESKECGLHQKKDK